MLSLTSPIRIPLVRLCSTPSHGHEPHWHYFDESGFHSREACELPTGSTIEAMVMEFAERTSIFGLHVQEVMGMGVIEDAE